MKKFKEPFVLLLLAMLGFYLAGYGAYRWLGPIEKHWPRGEPLGPDEDYPTLIASVESPTRELLDQFYTPCITLECTYYYLRYHGKE